MSNWLSIKRNRLALSKAIFLISLTLLSALIFFLRFPNNFFAANFYAEDGTVFYQYIYSHGILSAIFHSFNGYFIIGLYLLEVVGIGLNSLLFNGSIINLPASLALISYSTLGFAVTLPAWLFFKRLGFFWSAVLVLACSFVPMPSSDYAVIGTIGNIKWLFLYIAFVLVIYRVIQTKNNIWTILIVDLGFLICAYTNATVYALYPLIILPEIWQWLRNPSKKNLTSILQIRRFQLALLTGVLLLPQLLYVKLYGLPTLTGYLNSPFQLQDIFEIFGGRTMLYGFVNGSYPLLNDWLVVAICGALILSLLFTHRTERLIAIAGIYASLTSSILFVINRTGISDYYEHYSSSGPDQFFYAQNLVMFFVVSIIAASWSNERLWRRPAQLMAIVFILLLIPASGSFGRNNLMQQNVGTLKTNIHTICRDSERKTISVPVYPIKNQGWDLELRREDVCDRK